MKNRRTFIKTSGLFLASSFLPVTTFLGSTRKKKLGVALVGLGGYSTHQLAPALQETQYCELRGIVTGSPEKIPRWQEKYNIPDANVYNYDTMHQIANNDDIDVIYIVLPNSMHAEYTIKAANAGKHVWCEKPMAMNAEECRQMIEACEKNKVKLAIGYRLQHEKNNRIMMKWAETTPYGPMQEVKAAAGFYNSNPGWRAEKEMGGGAMYDMGVYPLNTSRYTVGREPIAVSAKSHTTRDQLFKEVDESMEFTLEFPDGIVANCRTSFGENMNNLEVTCSNGSYYLQPFQTYTGVKGGTSDGKILEPFGKNQQAVQMDDDALAILHDKPMMVPGEEGLKDIVVLEKIFASAAKNGQRLKI
ncbi:Gfo/Idh/MocA family oxidoreductase [Salinimicrobium tongyeongense]|uniref:Gfo/Idh/MocA family oxidoreductase n=1 Tax=Salinimicrobium tongyeongense TaxID=2809707 RepID=A0ABY6NUS3_9FLAO|nr:Gfo/Idh/MocA family oxidoreductase [Salinimicrobium tongyeongense]UZH56514.1 Gfo/Idh/MocA family oxidoreductase [Salinimicrobium tongyeongense]